MDTTSSGSASTTVADDRTVAILSYLTLIGFIVAIIIHGNKKTSLGAYHLRQSLGLLISAIVFSIASMVIAAIPVIGFLTITVGWFAFLVLWILGLVTAASGKATPVPVLGEPFQKWFAGAFA